MLGPVDLRQGQGLGIGRDAVILDFDVGCVLGHVFAGGANLIQQFDAHGVAPVCGYHNRLHHG